MKNIVLAILCICSTGFAATYKMVPYKTDGIGDFLIEGEAHLFSQRRHYVILHNPEEPLLKKGRGDLKLTYANNSHQPVNVYYENLRVTDQWGRPIPVVKKEAILKKETNSQAWGDLFSGLSDSIDFQNARKEGFEVMDKVGQKNFDNYIERQERNKESVSEIKTTYFDSSTLLPNSLKTSYFRISVPKHIENQLQYLFVNLDMDGETHTFCVYCAHKIRNCRR